MRHFTKAIPHRCTASVRMSGMDNGIDLEAKGSVLPCLAIVIPCFNEEAVLPETLPLFLAKVEALKEKGRIHDSSCLLFVDDGSTDSTWALIEQASAAHANVRGISLSHNQGHQNALLAGLMEARHFCDIAISIDCDGQDDVDAIDEMVRQYVEEGADIVYAELLLRESIRKELNDITKIIITQRAGVTKEADLILVMEDGRLIDQGKQEELIERCQTYREIMNLQIPEEEP